MQNEIRYYLEQMKDILAGEDNETFVPKYFITATKLPDGNTELAINTENIAEKINYILNAYDEDMRLKSNPAIQMVQLMVV